MRQRRLEIGQTPIRLRDARREVGRVVERDEGLDLVAGARQREGWIARQARRRGGPTGHRDDGEDQDRGERETQGRLREQREWRAARGRDNWCREQRSSKLRPQGGWCARTVKARELFSETRQFAVVHVAHR